MSRAFSIICGRDDACNTFEDSLKKFLWITCTLPWIKFEFIKVATTFYNWQRGKEPIYCTMHIPSLKALQDRNY